LTTARKSREKGAVDAAMAPFHPAVRDWFMNVFRTPTRAQELGWPAIARGDWTLIFAPTGSGKTLTAFLWALDRLMFAPRPEKDRRCRVVYISPLKALAVDVERNLRAPLTGIANLAAERGESFVLPSIAIRTGDTPQNERARFLRDPADILITTPESIYLMLTSNARDVLRGVETIIIDAGSEQARRAFGAVAGAPAARRRQGSAKDRVICDAESAGGGGEVPRRIQK
jgi:ATP-dependent Lhr-like helicase